jgi:hypothetical protein
MLNRSSKSVGILFVAMASCIEAAPVTWYLSGVTMVDGAIAGGSLTYDADTNTYSQVNITTSGGTVFGSAHYVTIAPAAGVVSNATRAILVTNGGNTLAGTPALALYPTTPLTNAGGTVGLLGSSLSISFETTCGGVSNDCDAPGFVRRNFTNGSLTTVAAPAPVPALSSWALFGLGILLLSSGTLSLQKASRTLPVE